MSETRYITAEELRLDLSRLPQSDQEAKERFEKWKETDPFPEIEPALLNSADLFDYLSAVGMVHPLDINPLKVDETLKPASCGIRLGGPCVYWTYEPDHDEPKQKTTIELDTNGVLALPPNSIAYATITPTIRLPDYIAARFNLSIKYVYQGLLVGTGPLVDPGFDRKLQIPLHNLTSATCEIPASDAVLWMEFTKLSPNERWSRGPNGEAGRLRHGRYVPFPERKRAGRSGLKAYLDHATGGQPVLSSIPELVGVATESAKEAADEAEKLRERAQKFQLWTAIVTGVALVGVIIGLLTYVHDVQNGISSEANTALQRSNELERELNRVRSHLHRLASGSPALQQAE